MRRQLPCAACAQVGKNVPSKYKCPACGVGSCSLSCVKHHKATTKCTGIRNRAAAVSKSDYDDTVFMNDYTLLEDTARQLRCAARIRRQANLNGSIVPLGGQITNDMTPTTATTNKGRLTLLAREAAARNTDLRFLPALYSRHKRNATVAKRTSNTADRRTLFWTLDVHADVDGDIRHVRVKSCSEMEKMGDIVRSALASLKSRRNQMKLNHVRSNLRRTASTHTGTNELFDAALDEDISIFMRNETVLAAQSDVVHLPAFRKHFGAGGSRTIIPSTTTSSAAQQQSHHHHYQYNSTSNSNNGRTSQSTTSEHPKQDEQLIRDNSATTNNNTENYDHVDMRKFLRMDPKATLLDSLKETCIVEFPVIHVAIKGSETAKEMEMACCGIFSKPEAIAVSSDGEDHTMDDDDEDDDNESDNENDDEKGKKEEQNNSIKASNGESKATKVTISGEHEAENDNDDGDDMDKKEEDVEKDDKNKNKNNNDGNSNGKEGRGANEGRSGTGGFGGSTADKEKKLGGKVDEDQQQKPQADSNTYNNKETDNVEGEEERSLKRARVSPSTGGKRTSVEMNHHHHDAFHRALDTDSVAAPV